MRQDKLSIKIILIALMGLVCLGASFLVLALVLERQNRFNDTQVEIGNTWGKRQNIIGPIVVVSEQSKEPDKLPRTFYFLPETTDYETVLTPEVRYKGIFKSIVYKAKLKVSGEFLT